MSTYDPTEKQLEAARRHLARDAEDRAAEIHITFAAIAGRLDAISGDLSAAGVEKAIRECRAALAAYDERRGGAA